MQQVIRITPRIQRVTVQATQQIVRVIGVGRRGPKGDPGSGDANFEFEQGSAINPWVIVHPLNKYPSVTVFDSTGREIGCPKKYDSLSQVTIDFGVPVAGSATLN